MNLSHKQEIYDRLNPESLHRMLDSYPEQIRTKKDELRNKKRILDNVELDRQERENEIMAEIRDETNPATGKAVYSNADDRKAELVKRCRKDSLYLERLKVSQAAETQVGQCQDEIEMLENKYKSMRYRATMVAAELRFWSGDEEDPVQEEQVQGSKQAY